MTEFGKKWFKLKRVPPLRLLDTLLFLISTSVYERWRTFPKNDWWRTFLTQNIKHDTNPPREDMIRTKFYVQNKSIHRGRTHFGLTLYFFQSLSTYWQQGILMYSLKSLQWLQSFFKALLQKKRKRTFSFKAILLEHEF